MKTLQENQSLNLEYQRNKELRELKEQLQQKENIIKEVRETLKSIYKLEDVTITNNAVEKIDKCIEILDCINKEDKK